MGGKDHDDQLAASGIYVYSIEGNSINKSKRMLRIKQDRQSEPQTVFYKTLAKKRQPVYLRHYERHDPTTNRYLGILYDGLM